MLQISDGFLLLVVWHQCVQRIDGFLAVLSITGGNFSPQSQKLPFSVTSVDGDCYLLYYASIDLAGNSSNKFRAQKLQKGRGHDDSQTVKSCFRIPMKGRIQLVLSCTLESNCWLLMPKTECIDLRTRYYFFHLN